jgi:alpha-L-rhamnosidase
MKSRLSVLVVLLTCNLTFVIGQMASCIPVNLRCEYLVRPIGIDATPRLSWSVGDNRFGAIQQAYRIVISTDSSSLAAGKAGTWDSERVSSDRMLVTYSGNPLTRFTKYYWSVTIWDKDGMKSPSVISSFETGMMGAGSWKGSWISDDNGKEVKEAPYLRKEFVVSRKIKSARAYIAAGGLYELYINGKKTGNHRLDPMYTRFDRRTLYVSYDVTSQVINGKNAIGVLLGNGWYNHQSTAVWFFDQAPWRNRPAFCMDLRITYEDGSVETIITDKSWKTSSGPLIFNSIYTAEHYDARLEQPGWDSPGFDDSKWEEVICRAAPSLNIVSQQLHPIRNVERIPAVSVKAINDTIHVFDLGRNIAGVSQFIVKAEAGTIFRLIHAERLDAKGRADISNISVHYRPTDNLDPFQTDIFIAGGKGDETFMPKFNYKGFQYVEVHSSKPVKLTTENLTGFFMHSDVPPSGEIVTSNPVINKMWKATTSSYLSNLFGYPTDCPQREKNGWTGDGQIAIETGLYNFDGITIYEKWLADHRDEQQPNGVLPAIIPTGGWGYHWANGPDWTSTIAVIPWNVYLFYGDSRLLYDCYENIKRYVDYITSISPSGLTTWGLGDWIPVKSKTPVELTSSVFYFADATILSKAAKLFGKKDDYKQYSALAEKVRNAINDKYLDRTTAIYGKGVQTELSFPLLWGVVPDDMKARVAENLAKRVAADNNHIDVGLLGSKAILNALSENGYGDLAYKVVSQETFPSWGWWIVNGATTLYENWPIDAKSDISLNHIMFGEPGAWFYKALGGIKPDQQNPGFKNTILRPCFVEGLTSASASHNSPYGEIISKWERNKKGVIYSVTVPANSTADLFLPAGYNLKKVTLSGSSEALTLNGKPDGSLVLLSGSYNLEVIRK